MGEDKSLINLGELSRPAVVLIEKISDAIGGVFRPSQIRRVAQAEAEAEKIRAVSKIEITDLQRRAMQRFFAEEAKKQSNIESITQKALPWVEDAANPQGVEDDWITNFFDKCRLISDADMQLLWARILAGEANKPGLFSKRTVNLVASLDKSDAQLFRTLCSFSWIIDEELTPLVYRSGDPIYDEAGLRFNDLLHLDSIGLISFRPGGGYIKTALPKKAVVFYHGEPIEVEFPQPGGGSPTLNVGDVILSKAGEELGKICESTSRLGFVDYILNRWRGIGGMKVIPIASESNDPGANNS